MHPIFEQYPEWRQIQKDREKLAKARAIHAERFRKTDLENKTALEKWRTAVEEAMLEGEEPPERPKLKEVPGDGRLFLNRDQELRDRERSFIANHSHEIEAAMSTEHNRIVERVRPAVLGLEQATKEMRALVSALSHVRGVVAPGQPRKVHRGGDALDIAELVRVISGGGSFIRQEETTHALNRTVVAR